ncbi:MAG: hypothetical protein MI745_15265 [Pseudomonadales bacterium]|nr:hypothetical protein [Pseudomonadales bacterium]
MLASWRVIVVFAVVGLAGCQHLPSRAASWLGWEDAPERVASLDYDAMASLGALEGACLTLSRAYQQQQRLPREELENTLLPTCRTRISEAQAEREYLRLLDDLIAVAWQQVQAAKAEKARLAEERRQLEEAVDRSRELAEDYREEGEAEAEREQAERLAAAHIYPALSSVQDLPLAYAVGQPSSRSLKTFLACLEIAYPNQGYSVRYEGEDLTVLASEANMLHGNVTMETRFTRAWDTWVLRSLRVGEIVANTPRDRYTLANNLVSDQCP